MTLVHSGSFATFGSANPHLHDARAQREGHMTLVHSGSFATFGSANPHLHDARAQREVFVVTVTFYLEIFPLIKEAIRSIRAVETAAHDSMSSGITWTLSCFPER
jgi:hypothetical protein